MRVIACVWVLLIVLTGCTQDGEDKRIIEESQHSVIELTPIDLSEGESRKYQAFLGSMSGAFKLKYEGESDVILSMDIWKNGHKVDRAGSIGDLFFHPEGQPSNNEVEVIISMDTVHLEGQNEFLIVKVNNVSPSGSSLFTVPLPWDSTLKARGLMQNIEPVSFSTDEPIPVFGMQATRTNIIHAGDLSRESLEKAEWAFVFTLCFDEDTP